MAEAKVQSYKVKEGSAIKMQVSSKKGGNEKKFELYTPGMSVKLSASQAISHKSEIEINDDQLAKAYAELAPAPVAVFVPEEPKHKK